MNINATLLVQVCNFLIAYVLLRILFFKPVVGVIKQDQAHLDGLIGQLNEKRKTVLALEQVKHDQWRNAQQEFVARVPHVASSDLYVFKGISPERDMRVMDDAHMKELENALVADIVQRIEHARN
jgi:hypothetical protein